MRVDLLDDEVELVVGRGELDRLAGVVLDVEQIVLAVLGDGELGQFLAPLVAPFVVAAAVNASRAAGFVAL